MATTIAGMTKGTENMARSIEALRHLYRPKFQAIGNPMRTVSTAEALASRTVNLSASTAP